MFIITLLSLIFSVLDLLKNKYYKEKMIESGKGKIAILAFLLFIHNAVIFYVSLSPIYIILTDTTIIYKLLYIVFLVFLRLHWYLNNNKCVITQLQNKLMDLDEKTGNRDPCDILFDKYNTNKGKIYVYYIIFALTVTMVKLYSDYKSIRSS